MWETIFSWNTLWYILIPLYLVACFGLVIIVLMQKGKGAGFAGAFGVGPGSETVFGPRARKSLPVRLTYIMAGTFMVLSLSLSLISGRITEGSAPEKVDENAISTEQQDALGSFFGDAAAPEAAPADSTVAPAAPAVSAAPEAGATPAVPAPESAASTDAPAAEPSANPESAEAPSSEPASGQ